MGRRFGALGLAVTVAVSWRGATAGTAVLQPAKDATLYEDASGSTANGSGQHLFAGATAGGSLRRALLEFDVAGVVPAGATITAAQLVLQLNRAYPGDVVSDVFVHRVARPWSEGPSDAQDQEGAGTTAEPGDATWVHTSFDGAFWAAAGGDFVAAPSAIRSVGSTVGPVVWSGAGLVADVQSWLDDPAANAGWILLAEETVSGSAKRFHSRDGAFLPDRPRLIVGFTAPVAGSGRTPDRVSDGTPLRLGKAPAGNLQLTWGASCLASDLDYGVYEGGLGNFATHQPVLCSTAGATSAVITPGPNQAYYLVVPHLATVDGSYGLVSGGAERPVGVAACRAQVVDPCP